jgi:SecD/SecF fusion protein
MQNKGAIQVFAILLALACIWHLSFTFVTNRVESKVRAEAGDSTQLEQSMLDSMKSKVVYNLGLVKYTYDECKKREINLGLDLKGGMNVTLEVSIPDLLRAMANNTQDSAFNKAIKSATELQKTSQRNYVDLFVEQFLVYRPGGNLASPQIFGHKDQGMIKPSMKNDEVISILKRESDQAILRTFEVLNARIDQFGVTQPNLQLLEGTNRILVELPGVKDPTRVQELLQATAKLEFYQTYENYEIYPTLEKIDKYLAQIKVTELGDSGKVDTIPADTNQLVMKPDTTKNTDTSKVDTNKLDTNGKGGTMGGGMTDAEQEKLHPLFYRMQFNFYTAENDQQMLAPGPMVGISAARDTALVMKYLRMPDVAKMLPKELKLRWTKKALSENGSEFGLIALQTLKGKPALEGDVITDAYDEPDDNKGGFRVTMKMNSDGAEEWAKITAANAPQGGKPGRSIAIVLDDKVYSYPTVESSIKGGISSISGNFTADEAKTLASVLKAGKLPTPATIVEQAVVGPSLGKAAINAGIFSLIAAFLLILVYMVFYYGKAGLVANLSLLANVFFLFGSLAALGTTLTLPGIAGIVLTLGMAVDANVLIYERIKEELRHGKRLKIALEDGFKMALSSIIDSNLTTIIIAIILMVFGAGPVKGFAVVLFIGILTSMFSAIFLSRLMFEWQLKKNWKINFSTKMTENFMKSPKFNFVGRRKIYYVISGILITAGIISFAAKGFNLGIDLKGGRSYTVVFDNKNASISEISSNLAGKLGSAPIVKFYGSNDRVKVITKYKVEQTDSATEREIEKILYDGLSPMFDTKPSLADFSNKDNDIGLVESYIVGPTVARDVAAKSIWAVALSLIMIFLYVFFRFKGWYFGLGALVALIHDVIIVLAVFSIFDGLLPINLEIDQAIIAAVLTVIGYSINDTVIIFDRIREYLGEGHKGDTKGLINSALNSTLSRTINTSFTVFLVLIISFIFGGDAVRGFAFAILIGVVVGTYSSICIATPIVVDLRRDKSLGSPAPAKK